MFAILVQENDDWSEMDLHGFFIRHHGRRPYLSGVFPQPSLATRLCLPPIPIPRCSFKRPHIQHFGFTISKEGIHCICPGAIKKPATGGPTATGLVVWHQSAASVDVFISQEKRLLSAGISKESQVFLTIWIMLWQHKSVIRRLYVFICSRQCFRSSDRINKGNFVVWAPLAKLWTWCLLLFFFCEIFRSHEKYTLLFSWPCVFM